MRTTYSGTMLCFPVPATAYMSALLLYQLPFRPSSLHSPAPSLSPWVVMPRSAANDFMLLQSNCRFHDYSSSHCLWRCCTLSYGGQVPYSTAPLLMFICPQVPYQHDPSSLSKTLKTIVFPPIILASCPPQSCPNPIWDQLDHIEDLDWRNGRQYLTSV